MWFLQVIAVAIILGLVFVGGMIQGESQEREHQRNKHRLENAWAEQMVATGTCGLNKEKNNGTIN